RRGGLKEGRVIVREEREDWMSEKELWRGWGEEGEEMEWWGLGEVVDVFFIWDRGEKKGGWGKR
uniref:hypothetical protein n=1 Tax=Paenibacillus xylanexedens TaxID=528191 RepID=UPI001C92C907